MAAARVVRGLKRRERREDMWFGGLVLFLLLEKVVVAAVVRCWYRSMGGGGEGGGMGGEWVGRDAMATDQGRWRFGAGGDGSVLVLWMAMGFCS